MVYLQDKLLPMRYNNNPQVFTHLPIWSNIPMCTDEKKETSSNKLQ